MTSGRLDDELRRMSGIAGQLTPRSLILFNESFAGTNEHEGSEIGYQIVRALLDADVRIFFVTHRFSFADRIRRQPVRSSLFLRAERSQTDAAPTSSPSKTRSRPATGKTCTTSSAAGSMKTAPRPLVIHAGVHDNASGSGCSLKEAPVLSAPDNGHDQQHGNFCPFRRALVAWDGIPGLGHGAAHGGRAIRPQAVRGMLLRFARLTVSTTSGSGETTGPATAAAQHARDLFELARHSLLDAGLLR